MSTTNKIKPVERTFYAPIKKLLDDMGFKVVQEIGLSPEGVYFDLLVTYAGGAYIVEVKVGDELKDCLDGIVQAYGYSLKYGTRNTIIICYPEDIRSMRRSADQIDKLAIDRSCRIISLTENLWKIIHGSVEDYFSTLKDKIDREVSVIQTIETASDMLEEGIRLLSKVINRQFDDKKSLENLLNELTEDHGLFVSLSSNTNKTKLRNQIIDLLAYLLVNQILFYFLYSKKVNESKFKVDEIRKIDKVQDLHTYFNQIKKIDFKPIYAIDVVSKIPPHKSVLDCINTIIGVLSPLRVDEIKYDLYGKLIGKCMPKETRKVLSSHYTKNTSAALLTNLLIETWDETVWDLACGSGTLLVASYNRKINLYEKIKGEIDKKDSIVLHKRFVEEDLTGMDIMPFACHLAGLNLSARNLNTRTNFIRIAHGNSLKFDCKKFPFDVDEAYGTVSNALEHFQSPQRSLDSFVENTPTPIKISPSTKFSVDKVDSVCINPPFTQYNKLPKKFREEFFRPELTKLFMKRTGLWACFLVLADKLIVDGGKIGAIVPVTFLRGEDPKGIRRYFLENYSFEYIIRPKINDCFSEDTGINDLIVIIKKTPPKRNKEVNIVFLNIPIDEFTISDIDAMIDRIKTVKNKEGLDDEFSLIKVKQEELNENIDQLMIYFFGKNLYNIKKINAFFEKIKDSNKTELIDIEKIRRGQQFRPKGESKRSIITRNYSKSRIKRATYYFDKDDSKFLKYYDKEGNEYEIDKQKLRKTFRTIIGIDKYDISDLYDYLIIKSDTPHAVGSQVIIAHKIKVKPKSPFFTSVYSDEKILPTDALTMYISSSDDESKIMSLYFSSIFYLIQFKRLDKKIKEDNLEIGEPEYKNIFIPNLEKISGDDINEILNYFEQNRNKKFPDIITQLKTKPQERVNLDKLFAKALSIKTSDEELFGIYDILLDEFQ